MLFVCVCVCVCVTRPHNIFKQASMVWLIPNNLILTRTSNALHIRGSLANNIYLSHRRRWVAMENKECYSIRMWDSSESSISPSLFQPLESHFKTTRSNWDFLWEPSTMFCSWWVKLLGRIFRILIYLL